MVYLAILAGLGLVIVDEMLRKSDNLLAAGLTVQVPAEASEARIQTVLAVLRQTPGIGSVHLMTAAETGRLLEPWLGSPVPVEELPVPRLIEVGVGRGAAVDLTRLKEQLTAVVPEIRVDDYIPATDRLRAGARPLQALLGAAIAGSLLLIMVLAVFTTRAALAARGSDIELLHLLGAGDREIAHGYAARSLRHGLIGGGIGAAAAIATLAALHGSGQVIRPAAPVEAVGFGDWRLWVDIAAMAAAAGIVAAASARATVLRRLARMP
jgi:cell division transport system permease protein